MLVIGFWIIPYGNRSPQKYLSLCVRFEVFMVMKTQVKIFWVVMLCGVVGENGGNMDL
jgi:hypothetical protein